MAKIACIGNITYDILAYTEKFPEEDTRCDYNKIITSFGGPAANAAALLAKYGKEVDFYGVIGSDKFSNLVYQDLLKSNINIDNLIIQEDSTIPLSYIIVTSDKKTRTINTYRNSKDNKNITFNNYKNDYDIILTDGKYPKATLELIKQNPTAITVFDAGRCNKDTALLCKYIDYIICSENFANDYIKNYKNINDKIDINDYTKTQSILRQLHKDFEQSMLVTTLGKEGYVYLNEDDHLICENALNFGKVVDTTAAGDIFHGAFVYALANNCNFEDCLHFSNTVSSYSVTNYGGNTSIPNLDQLENIYVKKLRK